MNEILLEIKNISKAFRNHQALENVSFSIPKGSIFGLLGPNGAGKTTLIRIINQITVPDKGVVLFNGEPLNPSDISKIGYLPEERGLYKKMKVLDQIIYFGRLKGLSGKVSKERANEWLKRFDIDSWRNKKVEELSKGMQQKIQFIITILHKPELIILDEPFSGFDPINTEIIKQEIKLLRDAGSTIIFSTHRMESVDEICDYLGMINQSKKVLEGNVLDVRNSFKEGEYLVHFKGTLDTLATDVKGEVTKTKEGWNKALLKINSDRQTFINLLNKEVDIISFEEHLPTVNEIFISKVKEETNG